MDDNVRWKAGTAAGIFTPWGKAAWKWNIMENKETYKPCSSCRHWSLELSLSQEYLVFWTNKLLLLFMPVWVEFFILCDCKHLVAWVQVSQNLTLRQGFLCTFFLGAGMQGKTREWGKQGWEEDEAKPRCDVGQSSPGITSSLILKGNL